MEQLTEKCQQLRTELKDCRQEFEQLQTKHTGDLAEMEALRSKFTLVSVHLCILSTFKLILALRTSNKVSIGFTENSSGFQ